MRRHTRYAVSIIISVILSLLLTSNLLAELRAIKVTPKAKEHRLALLIGNSDYTHGGSLNNSLTDVRAMKRTLESLGFMVLKYKNCAQKDMKMAMDKFGEKLKGQDVGLFFYSGHGVQVNGHNYLIPTDAKMDNENDAEYDCVRAGRILAKMESAGTRTNIVILDACRDNPFERSWRKGTKGTGLAFMNAPSGSLIAYSTAPGKTALDGRGNNSPYTFALLQHIKTPDITILEMFQGVRSTVMARTGGKQTPWESTSLRGNFYFNGKGEMTVGEDLNQKSHPPETTKELDAAALVAQARNLWKDGKYSNPKKVIGLLDKAIKLDPDYARAYRERGALYEDLKQHDRAIQDFDRAIKLDPGLAKSYQNRGLAYYYLNQYTRAIQDWNKAIDLDPDDGWNYYNRGIAYMKLKELSRACADLKKACSLGHCEDLEKYIKEGKCL